ncbi:MAG TPA: tetratricopeptide repeat protein [Candidatus Acidoferrum sp.]|jgi:tetratricopeptide (TPR) repeat protein|nr:tetratricopeptide repeat protein [Candidatus Acidoferrum sp.]
MKRVSKSMMFAALLAGALVCVLAPKAAAQSGSIAGTILDVNGKPWYGLGVQCVSDQGAKQDAKTDASGQYSLQNLRPGVYTVTIMTFPPPNDKQAPVEMGKVRVASGEVAKADMNFKDVIAKQGAAAQEQVKKQAEEKQKFENMKTHFTAGQAFLVQERKAKEDLQKAAPDQRDALKQNLKDLSEKAATELEAAQKAASEKDPNQHLLWATLGEAYDVAGRNEEAAQAYQQAINAKPDDPGYYNNLGNVLARAGKIDEARAAYTKSAELDPTKAATAWRNFGISLYNANRLGDAIEPLQKSAELDPKSAQTWYLLGASLVYKMTVKKVGDKDVPEFAPGTIEAYQKAIELDPNGPYGQDAKKGLEQLQLMSPGIDIKVNVKKKKS